MKSEFASAALILLGLPPLASAHGNNNDPNVVHACVGNISKVARIVGVNGVPLRTPCRG